MKISTASIFACLALCAASSAAAVASPMSDGDTAYKAGSYNTALADYQQAAAQETGVDQAKAYYKEGLTFHKLGQDSEAVNEYNTAQRIDPSLSFASSPAKFQHNLQMAQSAPGGAASTSSTPVTTSSSSSSAPSTDPAAIALANGDVYVAAPLQSQVDQTKLQESAQSNAQTPVKIAVLDRLPPNYNSVDAYASDLYRYLNLGNGGLIVVVVHGDKQHAGVADVAGHLTPDQEHAISQKYIAQIGSGDYTGGLAAMTTDLAATATSASSRPLVDITIVFLLVCLVIAALLISASRRKRVQINSMRGPLQAARDRVVDGILSLDKYMDVLPKNNADSDQVRAFRQAAAYKVEQAEKIMARSTETTDMNRAQSLIDNAEADVQNGLRYLDRATGGKGRLASDDEVQPIPFPTNQGQVSQVPDAERGVSFFSSAPAPVGALVPVTLNVDGQQRTVMATPQEAEQIRQGQTPPVRSFNVGGTSVPWYAYNQYDPYRDYYTYQNNGWRGVAGGAIAGFLGAEVLNSLFHPHPYWGGGWNSPYAYGPGWDSWGGWGNTGLGWDNGYYGGGNAGFAQDYALQDQYSQPMQDQNLAGGSSFMGGGGGYDTSDYGNSGGDSFMGGSDRS